jgi:hypothetical protein
MLLLLAACIVRADEEGDVAAIKTDYGYLLVWNRNDTHFTLEIKGKDVQPQNSTDIVFFNVDGKVLQVQSLPVSAFLKDAKERKQDAAMILKAHQAWEVQYLEESFGSKLKVESAAEKLSSGNVALYWTYDMPEGKSKTVKKQLYLTTLAKDRLLLLNSVVDETTTESAARQLLLDTAATWKLSSDKLDVEKLRRAIIKDSSQ